MEKIKKNLPVILLSVMCTLLLVIVILLAVDNKTFNFSNSSSKSDTLENNTKEIKEDKKEEKVIEKEETKVEEKKEEVKQPEKKQEKIKQETNSKQEEKSEANLLSYLDSESKLFTSSNNNESMTSKLKNAFTSIIDFIFYDKEIKGYTFKELTNSAKLKIISIALAIDNKIDSYFPDYKEKIKDKYNDIKGKLALKYLEITTEFCSKNPDTCKQARIDFDNMKESFGFTWDLLKEMAKSGTSKVKELYENWRDK